MNENKYEFILQSLQILASVRKYDRLSTNNGFHVESPQRFLGVTRWFNAENRHTNIYAVQHILEDGFQMCEQLVTQLVENKSDIRQFINQKKLSRLYDAHLLAHQGIKNLQVTYESDRQAVAKIKIILTLINDRLSSITKTLQVNQVDTDFLPIQSIQN
jgi:hypothetical protein